MQKITGSLHQRNKPLYTPMKTPLCIETRQGQFSWHLESERTTCVSKDRCLAVCKMILMVSLAFLLKLMGIIEEKSPTCISIVLSWLTETATTKDVNNIKKGSINSLRHCLHNRKLWIMLYPSLMSQDMQHK